MIVEISGNRPTENGFSALHCTALHAYLAHRKHRRPCGAWSIASTIRLLPCRRFRRPVSRRRGRPRSNLGPRRTRPNPSGCTRRTLYLPRQICHRRPSRRPSSGPFCRLWSGTCRGPSRPCWRRTPIGGDDFPSWCSSGGASISQRRHCPHRRDRPTRRPWPGTFPPTIQRGWMCAASRRRKKKKKTGAGHDDVRLFV